MENEIFPIDIVINRGYPFICIHDSSTEISLTGDFDDDGASITQHELLFSGVHNYNGVNSLNIYLNETTWLQKFETYSTCTLYVPSGYLDIQGGWDAIGDFPNYAHIPVPQTIDILYNIEAIDCFNIFIKERV